MADDHKMTALKLAPPTSGAMQKLADDLYWIRFTLPFRLNHINLFVFDTDDGWVLLDCGIDGAATAAQWQPLLDGPLAGRPVVGIIVSDDSGLLDLDQIARSASKSLAKFKLPRKLIVVDNLPRNAMGKVQKNVLRNRFESLFLTSS